MKKVLVIILALMLAGCKSWTIVERNAQPGDILYQDDFSRLNSGWLHSSTEVGAMDYFSGTYRIQVNVPDYDLWSVAGTLFTDVRIETDAGRLGGPEENRIGLICRYQDMQNYYFFIISSDGYYAIGKVSGGVKSLLGQPAMAFNATILNGMAPDHLQFDCIGSMLAGYVNGQMVAIAQDADLAKGDTGLLAGAFETQGVDIVFDNFVVYKP